jgi:hypothetical protein
MAHPRLGTLSSFKENPPVRQANLLAPGSSESKWQLQASIFKQAKGERAKVKEEKEHGPGTRVQAPRPLARPSPEFEDEDNDKDECCQHWGMSSASW